MNSFKDMVTADNAAVFLSLGEFAEKRTLRYGAEDYVDIPIILSGLKEKDRRQVVSDHMQGLYLASRVLHCRIEDLGGNQPEKGQKLFINDCEGGGGFFKMFYVASSICEMGMLRIELEVIDE